MSALDKLRDFYRNGDDPNFIPQPNHVFVNNAQRGGDRVYLLPGHFYSFTSLNPVSPDQVPTWDEYEILKNPSMRDAALVSKYNCLIPVYFVKKWK